MKKVLKMYGFYILMMFMFVPSVFAESNVYYTNHRGVEMTENEYNYLLNYFDAASISNFSQKLFDAAIRDVNGIETLESETIYIQTTTVTSPLGITTTQETIITKEEYENFEPIIPRVSCNAGNACWETNAKMLYVAFDTFRDSNGVSNLNVDARLDWKTTPNVKSYDVFAARFTDSNSGATFEDFIGIQDTPDEYFVYDNTKANSKWTNNAVGLSMNLVDDFYHDWESDYGAELYMELDFEIRKNTTLNFWITYQHATSNVTLAQSQDYTFGSAGLGGVLNYNSTSIRNKYDGMQGLNVSVAVFA